MLKLILLTLTVGSGLCLAQADRAAVTGTISDPSHSVVPNAKVSLVYPGTGLRREAESSSAGVFHIGSLPIGECYLEVGAAGFRSIQTKPFVLTVGETRTLDVAMELAPAASSVDVRDTGDTLTYSEASIRSVTSSQQLNELPVNGRNWQSFMALAPGAVDAANGNNTSVRFLATGGDDVNYRVDGVDATSIRNQNMRLNSRLMMSEDAIAEFRVNSALFTAESGGSGGGQVEVVSKSGSNSLHGSAFEYARDATFDARSPWDPATLPPFRLNQFGGTVGGPVIKNRTFFFLSYEGLRQNKDQLLSDTFRARHSARLRWQRRRSSSLYSTPSRRRPGPPRIPMSANGSEPSPICRTKMSECCAWITGSTIAGRVTSGLRGTTRPPTSRWRSTTAT